MNKTKTDVIKTLAGKSRTRHNTLHLELFITTTLTSFLSKQKWISAYFGDDFSGTVKKSRSWDENRLRSPAGNLRVGSLTH